MRFFSIEIPQSMLDDRMMTKQKYKSVSCYLRTCASIIHKEMDWEKVQQQARDYMLYGHWEIETL